MNTTPTIIIVNFESSTIFIISLCINAAPIYGRRECLEEGVKTKVFVHPGFEEVKILEKWGQEERSRPWESWG